MTNCFTRTEKQEEKTNGEIQETFFSIREQKIKKDAAGNGYLSDETIANRASDALLNYMEACYEKNGNLDAKAQSYWRAFRERAHPDTYRVQVGRNHGRRPRMVHRTSET